MSGFFSRLLQNPGTRITLNHDPGLPRVALDDKGYSRSREWCALCRFPMRPGQDGSENHRRYGVPKHVGHDLRPGTWDRRKHFFLHDDCRRFYPFFTTWDLQCMEANTSDFTPTPHEERRRFRYVSDRLALKLQQEASLIEHLPRLPMELWLNIASYLVELSGLFTHRELSICQSGIKEYLKHNEPLSMYKVNLLSSIGHDSRIYASYIKIDGQIYVKSYTDYLLRGGMYQEKDPRILSGIRLRSAEEDDSDLFLAHDHIGIRWMAFVSPRRFAKWSAEILEVPGVWWTHIPRALFQDLFFFHDHNKIRRIYMMHMNGHRMITSLLSFQTPTINSPTIYDFVTRLSQERECLRLRMRFVDFNLDDTIGYSVATINKGILAILAHTKGDKKEAPTLDPIYSQDCYWQYVPMDKDERLIEIGGPVNGKPNRIGIRFTTSLGRAIQLGDCTSRRQPIRLLSRLPQGPCRMYFNDLDSTPRPDDRLASLYRPPKLECLLYYAFDFGEAVVPTISPKVLSTDEPRIPPGVKNGGSYFFSSCDTSDLAAARPCIDRTTHHHRPVIGMLLVFRNGSQRCLGQVRLDWLGETIYATKTSSIFVCIKKLFDAIPYVAELALHAPDSFPPLDGVWQNIGTGKLLEWWFHGDDVILSYDGRRIGS
jgi:hypothetical protein